MRTCDEIQMDIYQCGDHAQTKFPIALDDWEKKAQEILGAGPFGYVYGAAGAGNTLASNIQAFKKYVLRPRVCSDVSKRSLQIKLFGKEIPVPFLFAPIGVNSILHPEAELAPAKVAAELGIPYILSNVSTTPMEVVAEAMGDSNRWFQLYPPKSEDLTKSFIKRAENAGYSAIVVTVDSKLLGWREVDLRNSYLPFLSGQGMGNYFTDPVFKEMLEEPIEQNKRAACLRALAEGNNQCFTWELFSNIRELTKLPLLIKGLTHPDDALLAKEHGADGIIVSNHGGRQLDGAIGTLDALPDIVEAINGSIPILLDSGIRHGADIIKALCLGADAVLIGRPYAYALAVGGQSGVKQLMSHFVAETELQLAISGRKTIQELDRSVITRVTL
ncbi:alpha-hydroxy-acid oxidizing protein [Paenibacillus sp. TRM 82003]|nr:alpha-hydroxy-acid oxidizing protein [Paenibacillus sp. TRM 82003]